MALGHEVDTHGLTPTALEAKGKTLMSFLSDWREAFVLFTTYQWGKPQPPIYRGNAEGANLPAIASRSGEAGGTPPHISR